MDHVAHKNAPGKRTASQDFLIKVCKDVLKLRTVQLSDDFFELGGDSLLALDVYERVRVHYRREIPLFDLSIKPTIGNLASVIDCALEGQGVEEYRSLKCVHQGHTGVTPLFLVHGGDGNARVFRHLAHRLDPRIPVFAFRWPGWDGCKANGTLYKMAESYVRELLRYRPEGAIRLGGYCLGGVVALHMAQMLKDVGRSVEGPVMIWDAPNFLSKAYHKQEPWYSSSDYVSFKNMVRKMESQKRTLFGQCESYVTPTKFDGSYEILRRFPWLYTAARTVQICVGTAIPIHLKLMLKKPVSVKWRWIYCMTTMFFALRKLSEIRYAGSVVYFRSDVLLGRPMNAQGWWEDPFMGFEELCNGDFKGYVIGGNHVSVLRRPEGAGIVNELYFGGAV